MYTNKVIRKNERYGFEEGWLRWFHLFSFANYFDPDNLHFWNLRVFNDDYIQAYNGFWMHPHNDMEIMTIMLKWELTHEDSMWHKDTIWEYEIQTMTAWTWVFHSEKNLWEQDTRSFQLWFLTNERNLKPAYDSHYIHLENNKLNLLASWERNDNVWFLNTEVKVFRWIFDENQKINHKIEEWRWLFIYPISWKIKIWDEKIEVSDQIRYSKPWNYEIEFLEKSDFILIEVNL